MKPRSTVPGPVARCLGMLVAAVLAVAACGHPLIPASALRPAKAPAAHARAALAARPGLGGRPVLGVDLYALSNYPAAQVRADGRRMLWYIKNVLKADEVGIVWNFYAASRRSDVIERTAATLPASKVGILTRIATRDHLLVEYRPLMFVSSRRNTWEGLIQPARPARWFRNYYRAELPYLRMAQRQGVSEFVTATEMHKLNGSPRWPSFLARVSRVYHGVTSYAAWDGDYFPSAGHLLPVRYVGMDMYRRLHLRGSATAAQVTAAWAGFFHQLPAAVLQRTAIDETGIQARQNAYHHPSDLAAPGRLNERVQAHWFTAACRTVRRFHLRGVFFWKADLADNPAHPATSLSTFEGKKGAAAISACARILHRPAA